MATDARGIAVPVDGWTGQVEVTSGAGGPASVSPSGRVSALTVWSQVAWAARVAWPGVTWSWSLTLDGVLELVAASGTYTVTFSGNCGSRLGFASASYAGVASWTAEGAGLHLIAPGPIAYTMDVARGEGGELAWGAVSGLPDVGGTDLRRPVVRMLLTQSDMVRLAVAWAARRYPGTVDVYLEPETIQSIHASGYRPRRSGWVGHSHVEIGGVRASG